MTLGTLLMIAANLVPAIGVFWWGWDAFVLLILYWLETAIIGFWTIVGVLLGINAPFTSNDGATRARTGLAATGVGGRLFLVGFFTVHAGIFMAVHFMFLWALFSGQWGERIHGVHDFISDLIIGTDLWIPLAFMFVAHGVAMFGPTVRNRLGLSDAPPPDTGALGGLYVRIFVMQFTIIIGGWFAILAGDSVGPLLLLVLLKTVVDLSNGRIFGGIARSSG